MNELFETIESLAFDTVVNTASDFKTVLKLFRKYDIVLDLIDLLDDWRNQLRVADRISFLMGDYTGPEEHPHDAAIAAYLYALSQANMALSYTKCIGELQHSHYFWASKTAKNIKDQK